MARSFISGRKYPKTTVEKVYEEIRDDIIAGIHPPGSHLVRQAMAKKYHVSVISIMEAFYRLEMDGLIENSPSQGAYVIEVTTAMIEQDRLLREALECQTARLFTLRASEHEKSDIKKLANLLDSLQKTITEDQPDDVLRQFLPYHAEFHFGIARMSGATRIYHLLRQMWRRRIMVIADIPCLLRRLPEHWHETLADLFIAGDPDEAEQQMRVHVNFQ